MRIEHVALWVNELEKVRKFYEIWFGCTSNEKYDNLKKGFESYFLTFDDGARLEIMRKKGIEGAVQHETAGYAHIALSLGTKESVDELTEKMRENGIIIAGEPRTTGDGYYESVVEDPEGNLIELTV